MICDLLLRARALLTRRRADRDLDDELAFHVACETAKLAASGLAPVEARRQAMVRFGSQTAIADDCRDARGTASIEAFGRDVAYAWRTWRRAPLAALTIIATMTLGLGLATTAFSVFNAIFLRVDAVDRPHDLFAIRRVVNSRASAPFTLAEYDAFRRETTVFTGTAAQTGNIQVRVDGRLTRVRLVTGTFFQVLGTRSAEGRALTPSDDQTDAMTAVVLSDRGWTKLFARDPGAIGRRVRVNGVDAEIVGIMPEDFFGLSSAPPDFWGPLAAAAEFTPVVAGRAASTPVEVLGRLKPEIGTAAAQDFLKQWAAGPGLKTVGNRPLSIALRPATGLTPETLEALPGFAPFFFAFGLVLLIGCANVANLLLARGVARRQEIGIRLSLGASRRRIARQLLTESLLLALVAAACAFPAARLFMRACLFAVATYSPPEMAEQLDAVMPALDWHVLLFLVVSAVGATMLFGLVPALYATRLDPVKTMRGELVRDLRPSRTRQLLIAAQVGASSLLLIAAALLLRGPVSAVRVDTGLRVHDTVMVSLGDETRRSAILDALAADPLVSVVSAASPPDAGRLALARATSTSVAKPLTYRYATRDFLDVIGISVVRGRGFQPTERDLGAAVVLVSESAAARLWPGRNAVGQTLRLQLDTTLVQYVTVAGVVRDVVEPMPMIRSDLDADLYLPAALETPGTQLTLRVKDDPYRARGRLLERLSTIDPSLGSVVTLKTTVAAIAFFMRALFALGITLGVLALLLTVSGLFSALSYIVEQRTKEIGVRMALGASAVSVVRVVFGECGYPVGIGLATGVITAAGLAGALMASPLASDFGPVVRLFDPAAYAVSLLVIVLACALAASLPTWRAVRVDPIAVLRKE